MGWASKSLMANMNSISNGDLLMLNSAVILLFSELAVGTQPALVMPTMTDALDKVWRMAFGELISRCHGNSAAEMQECMTEQLEGMPWHVASPFSERQRHNCSGKGEKLLASCCCITFWKHK